MSTLEEIDFHACQNLPVDFPARYPRNRVPSELARLWLPSQPRSPLKNKLLRNAGSGDLSLCACKGKSL